MNSTGPKGRVLKWQPTAKIHTCMDRDVYIAACMSAYMSWHTCETLTSVYCIEADINADFWEEKELKSSIDPYWNGWIVTTE